MFFDPEEFAEDKLCFYANVPKQNLTKGNYDDKGDNILSLRDRVERFPDEDDKIYIDPRRKYTAIGFDKITRDEIIIDKLDASNGFIAEPINNFKPRENDESSKCDMDQQRHASTPETPSEKVMLLTISKTVTTAGSNGMKENWGNGERRYKTNIDEKLSSDHKAAYRKTSVNGHSTCNSEDKFEGNNDEIESSVSASEHFTKSVRHECIKRKDRPTKFKQIIILFIILQIAGIHPVSGSVEEEKKFEIPVQCAIEHITIVLLCALQKVIVSVFLVMAFTLASFFALKLFYSEIEIYRLFERIIGYFFPDRATYYSLTLAEVVERDPGKLSNKLSTAVKCQEAITPTRRRFVIEGVGEQNVGSHTQTQPNNFREHYHQPQYQDTRVQPIVNTGEIHLFHNEEHEPLARMVTDRDTPVPVIYEYAMLEMACRGRHEGFFLIDEADVPFTNITPGIQHLRIVRDTSLQIP